MAKQRLVGGQGVEVVIPAQKSGLECPLCGCRTLNRDTAPAADGWYVEWCRDGVVEVRDDETGEIVKFDCPYASAGFKK